ncbi:type 2 periplasmic-binding domain-containing protein [Paenibacillus roseipurpureus]|uniref:Extracellular solute-binding protein n=1 Tax=Paenibacillus roseopurpureus TaxID=2918901 RepID=A0AA96RJC7_9BACL|nr:extracellular solute-binding protein [Paenibacillus sp. MBLB1832]WNR43026.1 extracellular solute-binding protein [Paenibacillus sp. MBLB1832]
MKKWIKSTAAMVLTASMFAGCSSPGAISTQSGGNSSSAPQATSGAADKFKEKLSLNLMSITYEGGGWPDKHPMIDFLNKKFNVDLKFQWVPSDTYKEKLGVLAASNSFPDAFFIDMNDFLKWRDKGVFLDVKPLLANYPNLTKDIKPETFALGNPSGKALGVPLYTPETRDTLVIRKDWLDKLGLKYPTNTDELYNVAKAFTKNDPDGNGKDDTIGFSTAITGGTSFSRLDYLKFAFGLANGWKEVNGALVSWQTQNKELKDFLGYLRKAYAEGILDKDFAVNKETDPSVKAEANKLGIHQLVATAIYAEGSAGSELNVKKTAPNAQWMTGAPPKGPTGLQGVGTGASSSKVVINAKIDKNKQERILAILDYLSTDEGDILNKSGVEGIHYKKTTDNKYEKLEAFDKDRPFIVGFWFFRKSNPLTTYRLWDDPAYAKRINGIFEENAKYANPNKGVGVYSETAAKSGNSLDQKLMSEMVKYIIGEIPAEGIDKAIDDWKKNGGDKIIEEMNTAYKAMK